MKKRIIQTFILITCCFLFVLANQQSTKAAEKKYGDYTYEVSKGSVTITQYVGKATKLTIPSKIAGKKVTKIGQYAFTTKRTLKQVVIPSTVTVIGDYAFEHCTNLTKVTMKGNTKKIGFGAFYQCTKLASVNIPKTVTTIGAEAFYNCKSLKAITLNEGLKTIGADAFVNCSSLISIKIPSTVTNLTEDQSFPFMQETVAYYKNPFAGCRNLKVITVATGNKKYKAEYGVLSTKDGSRILTFSVGKKIKNFTIAEGVKIVAKDAIISNNTINKIVIPSTVTYFGSNTYHCYALKNIVVNSNNSVYVSQDGALYSKDMTEFCAYPMTLTGSYTVPSTVTFIDSYAFRGSKLTTIVIPDSVTDMGYEVLACTKNLKNLQLSSKVEIYTEDTLYNSGIEKIVIPEGIETMEANFSRGCNKLKEVVFPSTFQYFYDDGDDVYAMRLFQNCPKLSKITVAANSKYLYSKDGVLYAYNGNYMDLLVYYPAAKTGTTYTVNQSVRVGKSAFDGVKYLKKLIFKKPVSLFVIDPFVDCNNLVIDLHKDSDINCDIRVFSKCKNCYFLVAKNSTAYKCVKAMKAPYKLK